MIELMKTEIFEALEKKNLARFNELLNENASLADSENDNGLTLLGLACHYGEAEFVEMLLNKGADINAASHSKLSFIPSNTALHAAIAGKQSPKLIKLLLQNGANVNAIDSDGHAPIQTAAFEGNTEIASLLIHNGADITLNAGQGSAAEIAEHKNHSDFINVLKTP
ncbi:ankyrin repeat domain-containing protein [Metabacillus idriensis]|uniref:ankyrin repeat domain-containing protein n=1 Tax=Metabacillus idriensis TaxID=324768 RepID=UPI003D294056